MKNCAGVIASACFPMGKPKPFYAVGHPHKLKLELQPRMPLLNGILFNTSVFSVSSC
jgi:hypothetical protein